MFLKFDWLLSFYNSMPNFIKKKKKKAICVILDRNQVNGTSLQAVGAKKKSVCKRSSQQRLSRDHSAEQPLDSDLILKTGLTGGLSYHPQEKKGMK